MTLLRYDSTASMCSTELMRGRSQPQHIGLKGAGSEEAAPTYQSHLVTILDCRRIQDSRDYPLPRLRMYVEVNFCPNEKSMQPATYSSYS